MTRPTRFLTAIVNSSSSSPSTNTPTTTTTAAAVADPPEPVAVEPDFVVVLAALLCALICVVGLMAVARCAWLRRTSAANGGARSGANHNNKGLKKKVLQSLPKYVYNEKLASASGNGGVGGSECAICLAEYADGDEIRVLPQCNHGFHVLCIDTWLGSHSSCPSCRQILVVTRCRKCGECPAAAASTAGAPTEARQDRGSSSGGFLPC